MVLLPVLAALAASGGWAAGSVLAKSPAQQLGTFEFTRIQLIACAAILATLCSALEAWPSVEWSHWPAFALSIIIGIVLGNLAMIECLRRGGPRRTELLLSLKAPLVMIMAFLWLGESPSHWDLLGALIAVAGVGLAVTFGGNTPARSERVTGSLFTVVVLGLFATAAQGFGFLVMKPALEAGTDPIAASAVRLLGAAFLISICALWPSPKFTSRAKVTPALLGRTILPGFIGYGVSSSLLLYAFANMDAGVAALLGSLSPIVILPILWISEGQRPNAMAVVGAGLAVSGVALLVLH
jgi:drug/metabolite transporter (DMT)-like permease